MAVRAQEPKVIQQTVEIVAIDVIDIRPAQERALAPFPQPHEVLDEASARLRCWLVDSKGLVAKGRAGLNAHKMPYAHEHAPQGDLVAAIRSLQLWRRS